jgi:hypothetical protein
VRKEHGAAGGDEDLGLSHSGGFAGRGVKVHLCSCYGALGYHPPDSLGVPFLHDGQLQESLNASPIGEFG